MVLRKSEPRKDSELCQIFGDRIRELRKKKKWTLEELAHRAGVHVTYLSGLERGRRNPTLKVISRLTRALGVTLAEVFRNVHP